MRPVLLVIGFSFLLGLSILAVLLVSIRQKEVLRKSLSGSGKQVIEIENGNLRIVPDETPRSTIDTSTPVGAEAFNSLTVLRGEYINWEENTLTFALTPRIEAMPEQVLLDVSTITQVQCWPEQTRNPDGSTTFLREAYIPFAPGKPLTWIGEIAKPLDDVFPTLDRASYLFVRLSAPYEPDKTNTVSQVVVLGC